MDDAQLSSLIGLIYDAAHDQAMMPVMLNALADALHAHQGVSVFYDAATHTTRACAPRQDPSYLRNYGEYWGPRNFIRRRSMASPVGALLTIPMFASEEELGRSEFFNEWLHPQGMDGALAANVMAEGSSSTLVCVYRPLRLGEFDAEERKSFSLLLPHLRRAALFRQRTANLELSQNSAEEALDQLRAGVLVVDAAARVLLANQVAEAMFSDTEGLRSDRDGVSAATPYATGQLRSAIADCAAGVLARQGRLVKLPRPDGGSIEALVVPLSATDERFGARKPAAIIVLTDPHRQSANQPIALQSRFGMTPAEAALAAEIVKGRGRQAAADSLGISISTARTHLSHIFEKTGTRRQAELVRLILGLTGSDSH